MAATNIGARLDRLPMSSFHYRIFWLIGAGMFFDGYDLYVGASVLGAMVQDKFATVANVAQFNSLTAFDGFFHRLKERLDGDFSFHFWYAGTFCDVVNDVQLDHKILQKLLTTRNP